MESDELLDNESKDAFLEKLLLQNPNIIDEIKAKQPPVQTIKPKPGFCVKTKTHKKEKIFINICLSDLLPLAKEISEAELLEILESADPSSYRVPMSLGEPHAELDLKGDGCTVYDVVIHEQFIQKVHSSDIFMGFFMTIVLEGLEYKYDLQLDRDWKILKNKKFFGTILDQAVRSQSKPLIIDPESSEAPGVTRKSGGPLIQEVSEQKKVKAPAPEFKIVQDPPEGVPEFLVAEIKMPKVKSAKTVTLDMGEDRILLQTRSNVHELDIYLPFNVVQEECGAQFNKQTSILTITMPVQESAS